MLRCEKEKGRRHPGGMSSVKEKWEIGRCNLSATISLIQSTNKKNRANT